MKEKKTVKNPKGKWEKRIKWETINGQSTAEEKMGKTAYAAAKKRSKHQKKRERSIQPKMVKAPKKRKRSVIEKLAKEAEEI
jgi:hypothetical protein